MRRIAVVMLLAVGLVSAETGQPGHPFVCTDNGHNKVLVVDASGAITWEYPAAHGQDVWALPNGNLLFNHSRGILEVTREKQVVWEYRSPDGTEIHNCQPLPDGGVFCCENGTRRLLEWDRQRQLRKELVIKTTTANVHGQFRVARKLADGHYLVAYTGENAVVEFDAEGREVRRIKVPGNPFVAVRLPDGNTLIACGDGHKLIEVDPRDRVVWQIDEQELPGHRLRFVAGVQRLPNGNTVVCNWGGHGHVGQQPQIFEVTRDKRVVWQVADPKLRTVSSIMLLDVAGDPTRGEVLR